MGVSRFCIQGCIQFSVFIYLNSSVKKVHLSVRDGSSEFKACSFIEIINESLYLFSTAGENTENVINKPIPYKGLYTVGVYILLLYFFFFFFIT